MYSLAQPMGQRTPPSMPDLSGIREQLKRLLADGSHESLIELVLHLLEKMAEDNTRLAVRLHSALRQLYRKKSERISAEQLALFLTALEEAPEASAAAPPEDSAAAVSPGTQGGGETKPASAPKRPRKRPFPDNLRREVKVVSVPEEARTCATCHGPKEGMGYQSREVWEFKPAEFYIVEERLEKVVCKHCEEGVVTAVGASKPIEGGRPGPGLLAQIVTSKLDDGCPLYRQSDIYQRSGIHLAPSTLGDWFAAAAEMMRPLWRVARQQTLCCYLLSLDDTGMPVLDRDTPHGVKRGHLWTYVGNYDAVAFCEYTPDWKGDGPQGPSTLLADFTGQCIQGDGYAGINDVFEKRGAPKRAGCMDHCRRKFVAALEAGHTAAALPLKHIQDVYAVERLAREEGLGVEALLARRQAVSRPLMDALKRSIAQLHGTALPKGALGKAVTYAIRQWDTLCVFLDDARVPLSNAHVERQQRRIALGRKNYLFAGSDEGGKRLAILQTFVVLCDFAGIDTFEYLRDVLGKLPDWPNSRLAELLPAPWAAEKKRQKSEADAALSAGVLPASTGPPPATAGPDDAHRPARLVG